MSPPDPNMSPSTQSHLQQSSCMILSWLRSAVPLILKSSNHPIKLRKEHPITTLTTILSDAVVLADLVSYLDPTRLSPSNILRTTPRNALSTPLPTPHATVPIDTRQKSLQYENNTRRILFAVRKILDDVRAFTHSPLPPSGALDKFLGDVTKIPPSKDIRPALRLAEVIIACACYGPRHNEFRHAIWQFDTEPLRTSFLNSMKAVADALSLPSPDILYAPAPPPHSPIPSPTVLSPRPPFQVPHPQNHPFSPPQIFSPPGRLGTPPIASPGHLTPPLQPQPFPYPLSPPPQVSRAPVYQKPHMPMSPRATLAPHTATRGVRSPVPAAVPPPIISPSVSPQIRTAASPRKSSPRGSPNLSRSPRVSSRKSGSTSSSARGSPRTLPKQAAANPHVKSSSRSVVSPRYKNSPRNSPKPRRAYSPRKDVSADLRDPIKQTSNVTDPGGVVNVSRSLAPDTPSASLAQERASLTHSQDEGMDFRKFSMVTDEKSGTNNNSPIRADPPAAPPVDDLDVRSREVVDESKPSHVSKLVQRFEKGSNESKRSSDSKRSRSSEEFFTPGTKEALSPDPAPLVDDNVVEKPGPEQRPAASSSSARPPKYNPPAEQYPLGRVDEIVRQSVTSSVIKQFTRTPNKGNGEPAHWNIQDDSASREVGTTSATSSQYGPESYRSVDFMDPRFMQSPLEAPSPSGHWNMSQQREVCEGILSPQPLFSPPQMPQRLRRSTTATQMTPPVAQPQAPNLFRSGSASSQLSYSSAGDYVPSAREAEDPGKNQKVSFAPVITTPGGRQKPLGEPLDQSHAQNVEQSAREAQDFSLPPSAGPEEEEAKSPTLDDHDEEDLPHQELQDNDRSSPSGLQVYDDRDEEQYEDHSQEEGENPDLDSNQDLEENFSDRATFEEVEEYVVYNSDEQTDEFLPTGEEEPRFVQEEVLASSCEFDLANEEEGQTQFPEEMTQTSPDHSDRDISEAASQPEHGTKTESAENEEVGDSGRPQERSSEPNLGASARHPQVSRPISYSTPGYLRREVPPTPPSPPAIEDLVRSFSNAKELPESLRTRSVSTMEPSADLFQKLISVWQNADDDQRTELSQSQIVVEGLPTHVVSSDPPASQSTQASTLRSGDIESQSHEAPFSLAGSRGRRPRAVRLPEGLKTPQRLSSSFATREESKSPEVDESSAASFSDAFSSEDKEHPEGAAEEWEAALKGHGDAGVPATSAQTPSASTEKEEQSAGAKQLQGEHDLMPPSPSMVQRKAKSHSTSTGTGRNGVLPEDHLVKVDRRRLDWLTRQLLAARDAISRKDLQMTFAETERSEQREILLLEKQDAQSVVDAMKKLLAERENELQTARDRLSVAIDGVSRDRSSAESKTSAGGVGQDMHRLMTEGHTKLHEHIERSEAKQMEANQASGSEMKELLVELQRLLVQTMAEMTEKRDAELDALRNDLRTREKLVSELQKSSAELMNQNREIQSEASAIRLEKERADHRYKMEMSHVSAQVELVNEFSKKLHDNFRETENLRQQILHYQDKLSQITSTSGISKRQIKELREAVTRANDECARLRREADSEKRKRMEAIRRAEELEDLRMQDDQANARYPDRMDRTDSGSFRSHDPVRPAGQNRPGGSGINARYHARARGGPASPNTAQKAWLVIKDKIGGIVTGKDGNTSRRRGPGHSGRRDYSKGGSSQSSHSQSRSRGSPRDDDFNNRSRSGSLRSRSSQGSGSSIRSGPPRSNRSGGGSAGRRVSPVEDVGQYMHTQPYGRNEVGRIRATDF